jgi:hypothetical protein
MKYPKWVPGLRAWGKAIGLAIPAYCGVLSFAIFSWFFSYMAILVLFDSPKASLVFLSLSVGSLAMAFLWYVLLLFCYSFVLRLFWSDPPEWLKPPKRWSDILSNLAILLISSLPISTVLIIQAWIKVGLKAMAMQTYRIHSPDVIFNLFWLWLISAAYCYQFRHLSLQRIQASYLGKT